MSIASFILLSAGLITIVPGTWAAPYAKDGNNVSTAVIGQKYYFTKGNDNLYTICGDQSDDQTRVKIVDFNLSPDKIKKGTDMTISANLKLLEVISSGDVKVSLNYGTIPIVNETLDLCDLVTQVKRKCPLKDNLKFSLTENIPSYVPSGKYSGKLVMSDQNGKELLCLELNLTI